MMAHCFSHSIGDKSSQISDLEASLVYRASSRTARATQRDPVLKRQKDKREAKQKEERLAD